MTCTILCYTILLSDYYCRYFTCYFPLQASWFRTETLETSEIITRVLFIYNDISYSGKSCIALKAHFDYKCLCSVAWVKGIWKSKIDFFKSQNIKNIEILFFLNKYQTRITSLKKFICTDYIEIACHHNGYLNKVKVWVCTQHSKSIILVDTQQGHPSTL